MTVNVDLSKFYQDQDWPTMLTNEQRTKLLLDKIQRAKVYRYLEIGNTLNSTLEDQQCSTQL
jgi:hypothetical protein